MDAVRLIVSDIEGCLSPGKGRSLQLDALSRIQSHNVRASEGDAIPLTLCTGRSQPFVEAFCQALATSVPAVCENGAYLYDYPNDRIIRHPDIPLNYERALADLRGLLSTLSSTIPHQLEPCKEVSLSINPPGNVADSESAVVELFHRIAPSIDTDILSITHSASAVDITPAGINKGSGITFLSEMTGVPLAAMLGIGDALNDVPFLSIVGYSATPANGASKVAEVVDFVSPAFGPEGVEQIIAHFLSKPTGLEQDNDSGHA